MIPKAPQVMPWFVSVKETPASNSVRSACMANPCAASISCADDGTKVANARYVVCIPEGNVLEHFLPPVEDNTLPSYGLISGGGISSVGPTSIPRRSLLWRTL
jgi:hypothetical protein